MKKINVFDSALSEWHGEMAGLRFSKLTHQFTRDGVTALYHSLTHQVLYLDSGVCETISRKVGSKGELAEKDQQVVRELIKHGFLVSREHDEYLLIDEVASRFLGKPSFGILYLLLTDVCNLSCRYCFIEGAMPEHHTFSWMSEETAIKGLNFFAQVLKRNPKYQKNNHPLIIFYGGEPLLNQKTFLVALDEIVRLRESGEFPSKVSISLLTNATTLNENLVEAITKNKVAVSVSLDGPKDINDANRVFRNKEGTFDTIIRNIEKLREAGAKVSISCTINPQNLNQLEEVFQWMVDEFQLKGLGFNILLDLPGMTQANEEYARRATEKIIECYQIAREKGIYEDRIMRKVKAFVTKSLHLVDCGGCGNQIVIAPNGKIGPCHAYVSTEKFFPGHVDEVSFDPFTDPIFREWSRRSPFNIPECRFCEAIGLCGGGCPYNAELKEGSIWKVDSNFCIHSKMVLEWLVWDLFSKERERR